MPWAGAAEDHQTLNASAGSPTRGERRAAAGARGRPPRVGHRRRCWADPAALAAMAEAAFQAGDLHRGGTLADVVEDVAAGTPVSEVGKARMNPVEAVGRRAS